MTPWWAFAQRAYLVGIAYLLIYGALWLFAMMVIQPAIRFGSAASNSALLLVISTIVFLVSAIMAIPLAVRGDAVALKHRNFADADAFRGVQRAWARWGATVALASVFLPAVALGLLLGTVRHSPEGLNSRLLAASSQGNVAEIRAVLDENRERYGTGATNLNWDIAIGNAQYSGNAEAVRLLQEVAAQRRQGRTNL